MSEQPTIRPTKAIFDQASVEKKLGSRITAKQIAAVKGVEGSPAPKSALRAYAVSGDSETLTDAQRTALTAFVKEAKNGLETDSQKRRLWPRKVAAIIAFG